MNLFNNVIQMSNILPGLTHISIYSGKLFVKYLFKGAEGCIDPPRKQEKGGGWRNGVGQNGKRDW